MPHEEWLRSLTTSLPRFFNILSGRCTLVLSECIVECSKAVLSAQSPVLEEYFMSSERDINKLIVQRRKRYLGECAKDDDHDDNVANASDDFVLSDDEDDETSAIVMTDYYGYDDIVSEFFRSFYTGEITINADTHRITFKLACQYEVPWLISECCRFLESFLNEDNFIENFKFLMCLKNVNISNTTTRKLLSFDYDKLLNKHDTISSHWFNMDEHMFIILINHLQPPCELYIARLLFLWLEHDEPHRKSKFETLIQNLRLVHLPQSFVTELLLKYAEIQQLESRNLYRMVLGAQSYFFSQMAGMVPTRRAEEQFPKIYESRSSFVRTVEYVFDIPLEAVVQGTFETDVVSLLVEEDSFKLVFTKNCCFVYMTNSAIAERYPVSKVLIPVSKCRQNEDGIDVTFVSKEIELMSDCIANSDELSLTTINMVAIFLEPENRLID